MRSGSFGDFITGAISTAVCSIELFGGPAAAGHARTRSHSASDFCVDLPELVDIFALSRRLIPSPEGIAYRLALLGQFMIDERPPERRIDPVRFGHPMAKRCAVAAHPR
jgi:hypothetical protein